MNQLSRNTARGPVRKQSGAVLFIALMFLLLLSVVAVVAANTSLLQERMTGGMRNSQLAMMGAESALRSAEFRVWSAPARGVNLRCTPSAPDPAFRCFTVANRAVDPALDRFRNAKGVLANDGGFDSPVDLSATTVPESARLATRGRVMVEEVGRYMGAMEGSGGGLGFHRQLKPPPSATGGGSQMFMTYRITARSTGGSTGAVRVAESLFIAQVQPISTTP